MKITLKQLVYLELIYTVFAMQWMTYVGISNIKVLFPDVINIIVFAAGYNKIINSLANKKIRFITGCVALFWFITFFFSLFGEMATSGIKGVILAVWNMRIFMRPFFYMLLCYTYFNKLDLEKIFKIAYKLQFVNVLFTLFQYYIQHIWMDQNGGIFAPVQGCNKYSNIYCCIMMSWSIARYMKSKGNSRDIFVTFCSAIVVAVYSELKFLFIEMIIVTLLCIVFSGSGKKVMRTALIGVIICFLGMLLLMKLFPSSYQFLTDYDLFIWYAKDMSYSQTQISVNRLSGFDVVNQYMFKNSLLRVLFGFGWGSTAQIPFIGLYGPIMTMYRTLSYITFTYSWIYAELGTIGLVLFGGIFISIFCAIAKYGEKNEYTIISKTICVLTVILTAYDSSWVTEGTAFMCALAMSAGLIAAKRDKKYD